MNQDPKKHGVGEHQSLEQHESLSLTSRTPHEDEDDEQHLNSKNRQRKLVLHFPPIKALLEIESEIINTILEIRKQKFTRSSPPNLKITQVATNFMMDMWPLSQ